MANDQHLRASDAERDTTAGLLRRHHAEGRLDTTELEERIESCYAAKTRGELEALTTDLPGRHQRSTRRRTPLWPAPLVVVALIVVASITGAHVFWLVWPLAFFAFARFGRRGWPGRVTH
jgi:uncharacterized protein DUF1707